MTSNVNDLLDPPVCSCFPGSYHYTICNKIKWSTLSIGSALLIIIVYISSGLYALIDVTTMLSTQSYNDGNDMVLWPIASSSLMTILGWLSVSIYFTVVLLITVLLCGIQLGKPWLLFVWSIMMIVMLLADGIVTVLSLRQHQQQNYRPTKQVKILFFVMTVRLIVSLSGIFVTIFHFRRLNKAQSEQKNRQRMLDRYNSGSPSPSYHDSWARSAGFFNPSKDGIDDRYVADLSPPISLPRAKIATVQHNPISTMLHLHNQQLEYIDEPFEGPISRYVEQPSHGPISRYNDDFRYNIPLQERFHQQQIKGGQEF